MLSAHTLVWGAGLQGNELVQSLGLELERGNRLAVDEELRLAQHPEVYVVGDVAAITDAKTEQVLPQLGSVALQSGEHAGETIARRVAGKETKPFAYRDKGTMATIGRGAAVVQMLGGRTMKGRRRRWPGEPSTSRCCPRTRTAPRRSSTGRGPGSRISALAGSAVET